MTLNADGTVLVEVRTEDDPRYGPIQGTSRGTWAVEGDRLVMRDMRLEAKAAEGSTNPFGGFLAGLTASVANTFMREQQGGSSDVLRLSRNELVFRGNVEDPPVVACTR